jgi:hypothetical protein
MFLSGHLKPTYPTPRETEKGERAFFFGKGSLYSDKLSKDLLEKASVKSRASLRGI